MNSERGVWLYAASVTLLVAAFIVVEMLGRFVGFTVIDAAALLATGMLVGFFLALAVAPGAWRGQREP